MDPVPDPLLLRKSDRAWNRAQDLWICNRKLWPLGHRGGPDVKVHWFKSFTKWRWVFINRNNVLSNPRIVQFINSENAHDICTNANTVIQICNATVTWKHIGCFGYYQPSRNFSLSCNSHQRQWMRQKSYRNWNKRDELNERENKERVCTVVSKSDISIFDWNMPVLNFAMRKRQTAFCHFLNPEKKHSKLGRLKGCRIKLNSILCCLI
jgi:hypothetical protein